MRMGLSVNDLVVEHRTSRGTVHAVSGVSLEVAQGETLGLVGESGCGKSSLARVVSGLSTPTSGQVVVDGTRLDGAPNSRGRRVQMIFQDPFGSLNPRLTVRQLVEMPLNVHRIGSRRERQEIAATLLSQVGIPSTMHDRLPHQLSGGQRQRVGIARALILRPDAVICDEPVSALDVSVQAQVLNLLMDLQRERGLAYLFISHDLDVIRYVSHRIAVMYLGVIVEVGPSEDVWHNPRHPYTRSLIASIRGSDGEARGRLRLKGELPSPLAPPSGCRFRTRCPFATEICTNAVPQNKLFTPGHFAACHRSEEIAIELADGRRNLERTL